MNQWHHAEQNWLANVAFWLRTSQWFLVVRSVVEYWLLKQGILGFRIPGSWWLFYIKKKCFPSMPMAVFVFQGSRHFHARFCPRPFLRGFGASKHDIPSHYLKIVVSGGR